MDIDTYLAGESEALQRVLAESALVTEEERRQLLRLNSERPSGA